MKYDTLLFDVDNTLLDFDANEAESFRAMVEAQGERYTEELFAAYRTMNEQMWRAIERGEATTSEVVNTRFSRLMSRYGKQVNGAEWEQVYRSHLNRGLQEMPGVHEVLSELGAYCRLYIITNGMEETQEFRLSGSGLRPYFKDIFISESIGAGKPSKEFFDYVKSHIEEFEAAKTLVIGDSLTSDILGGKRAGIATCLYTRKENGVQEHGDFEDVKPDYIIHSLDEIKGIVK